MAEEKQPVDYVLPGGWCETPANSTKGAKQPRSAKQSALKTDASSFGTSFLDEDGSVFVEYIILVGMFGLMIAGAMLVLSRPLMSLYLHTQLVWGGSFP